MALFLGENMKKITTILIILIIILCIPATVPRLLGYNLFNVISGSMEPSIPVGSAVLVKAVEPDSVNIGDVISFYGSTKSEGIVTHRVKELVSEERQFITKGDANPDVDIYPTDYSQLIGKVVISIPFYGYFTAFLSSFYGKMILIVMIAICVLLNILFDKRIAGDSNEKR